MRGGSLLASVHGARKSVDGPRGEAGSLSPQWLMRDVTDGGPLSCLVSDEFLHHGTNRECRVHEAISV